MPLLYFVFYISVAVCTLIYFYLKKNSNYWQSRGIFCEKPHLLFGNLTGIQTERSFADIWREHYKKFRGTGPFSGFYWFQKPSVFILEPSLIKNILIKDFSKFTDRGFFHNEKDDPLSGHLFNLDGNKWRSLRNKLSPTFTSGKMKFMFPTVVKVAKEFVTVFDTMVKEDSVVEVKELLARFTTDVIGTCAFGIDCNSLKDPNAEFRVMGKKALVDQRHNKVVFAFMHSFPELARRLHLKETTDHIEKFFMGIVKETVSFREANNIKRNDFMDLLIDLKNNKLLKDEQEGDMKTLSIEEVAAQAFVFHLAGFETSSTTMGFVLYELARHENIQQKVRDEINAILAKNNNEFTYECMKEMQYLDQVISETLRLYTILPVLNRQALEDYVVPGHPNYVIKKGMNVIIPTGEIHKDPKYYPDPQKYDPDRFAPDKVKERDSILFMPFGDGPRNCIGMRFGKMQARIGLAFLLKHFKFSFCKETLDPLIYDKTNLLVCTKDGIYLKVEKV